MELQDAVVIITGASEGLGAATARRFAREGARVALVARTAGALSRLASELPGSLAVPTDMRDVAAIARMVAQVRAYYGRIDLLVNNAGQGMHGRMEHVGLADYRHLMDLNLYGPLAAMQAVIPIMRAQKDKGGLILNVSTLLTRTPFPIPGLGAYTSTKVALETIMRTARAELAEDNIRITIVYPGHMATSFGEHVLRASPPPSPGAAAEPEPGGLPDGAPSPEPPDVTAARLLEAVRDEPAEFYADPTLLQPERWQGAAPSPQMEAS
jgi:NAD(P)-dependent dehydrogenase (short-subunit alcohol dehydrogenase family)